MRKILLPVAGDGLDDLTLQYAEEFVKCMGAVLYVVTVTPYSDYVTHPYLGQYVVQSDASFRKISEEVLRRALDRIESCGLSAEKTAILQGDPASEILDYAEAEHVDLILMHTHGMGIIRRFTVGSVTNTIVHHSNVPVFVIK